MLHTTEPRTVKAYARQALQDFFTIATGPRADHPRRAELLLTHLAAGIPEAGELEQTTPDAHRTAHTALAAAAAELVDADQLLSAPEGDETTRTIYAAAHVEVTTISYPRAGTLAARVTHPDFAIRSRALNITTPEPRPGDELSGHLVLEAGARALATWLDELDDALHALAEDYRQASDS